MLLMFCTAVQRPGAATQGCESHIFGTLRILFVLLSDVSIPIHKGRLEVPILEGY